MKCWLCNCPERDYLHQIHAKRPDISCRQIARWLKEECGYAEATSTKVERHFRLHYAKA